MRKVRETVFKNAVLGLESMLHRHKVGSWELKPNIHRCEDGTDCQAQGREQNVQIYRGDCRIVDPRDKGEDQKV